MISFKALKNKNLLWLSFCFAVFFFGFNGFEQFLAVFFKQLGKTHIALTAMAIIYSAIIPASIVAPFIIGKIGLKKSLIFPGIFYAGYVFGVITLKEMIIYPLAILLGLSAAPLAVARGTYLLKTAEDDKSFSYGEALGAQDSIRAIGSTLGVLSVSLLTKFFPLKIIALFSGSAILLAVFLFTKVQPLKREARHISLNQIPTLLKNFNLWLIFPTFFTSAAMLGVSLATLPLIIKKYHGIFSVGPIMAIFSLGPIFLSILLGRLSDQEAGKWRKPIVQTALLGSIIAIFILLTQSSLFLLALACFLITILFTTVNSAGGGLIGQFFSEKKWETAQALLGIGGTLGVIAPLVGEQILPRQALLRLVALSSALAFGGIFALRSK